MPEAQWSQLLVEHYHRYILELNECTSIAEVNGFLPFPEARLSRYLLECAHVCREVCAIVTERYVHIPGVSDDIYQALFCSVEYWGLLYPLADPALSTFIFSCKAWFLCCLQNACRELAACPTAFGLTAQDTGCFGIWSSFALPLYISYWVYMLHTVECHPLPPLLHLVEWKCSPACQCNDQMICKRCQTMLKPLLMYSDNKGHVVWVSLLCIISSEADTT